MIVLGIDPGKSTGFYACSYDPKTQDYQHLFVGVTRSVEAAVEQIQTLAETLEPDVWVVEDYVINPHNAKGPVYKFQHTNDSGLALRVIGSAQGEAQRQKKKFVLQRAQVKAPGYGFLGLTYVRGKKEQHAQDAKAHAVYYLVSKVGMNPALCRTVRKKASDSQESSLPKFRLQSFS